MTLKGKELMVGIGSLLASMLLVGKAFLDNLSFFVWSCIKVLTEIL
jgi:hypothetical protein